MLIEKTLSLEILLKDFFYTVRRNRVDRALRACGVRQHVHFAKWSTVKDPQGGGGYVLPYGFVQSPLLASLVLAESPGRAGALRRRPRAYA